MHLLCLVNNASASFEDRTSPSSFLNSDIALAHDRSPPPRRLKQSAFVSKDKKYTCYKNAFVGPTFQARRVDHYLACRLPTIRTIITQKGIEFSVDPYYILRRYILTGIVVLNYICKILLLHRRAYKKITIINGDCVA